MEFRNVCQHVFPAQLYEFYRMIRLVLLKGTVLSSRIIDGAMQVQKNLFFEDSS